MIALDDGLRDGTVDASASQSLGSLFRAQPDVTIVLVYLFTGVAGGTLAFLLYRSKLVPMPARSPLRRK